MVSYALRLAPALMGVLWFSSLGSGFDIAVRGNSDAVRIESGTRQTPAVSGSLRAGAWNGVVRAARTVADTPAWQRMMANISPEGAHRGAVVAAPSGNFEYQFNWTRDAAIVMREVFDEAAVTEEPVRRAALIEQLDEYASFSRRTQEVDTISGNGEPKHTLQAEAFSEPWGRPQDDGPALRASLLIDFERWRSSQLGPRSTSDAIDVARADLDYLAGQWRNSSWDLWEEEVAAHYYTRVAQRRAFEAGASFFAERGQDGRAASYGAEARAVDAALSGHWDAGGRYLRAKLPGSWTGGKDYKQSGLDIAVLLAELHTRPQASRFLDDQLLATATRLEDGFRNEYAINHGVPNYEPVHIGRYTEDRYTGHAFQDRVDGGNPWLLTTNAFGEFHYRTARAIRQADSVPINEDNAYFFARALGGEFIESPAAAMQFVRERFGTHRIDRVDDRIALAEAVESRGDAFVGLAESHVIEGHHAEQVHRAHGGPEGAEMLTWTDASFVSAYRAKAAIL